MKRRWLMMTCCLLLPLTGLKAQTFSLKPVKLLPAAKKVLPAPAREKQEYPVYLMAPNAYYDQHFGFFCKQEWTWQKHTGIPVKLRLGNYSYTQQLEGKH